MEFVGATDLGIKGLWAKSRACVLAYTRGDQSYRQDGPKLGIRVETIPTNLLDSTAQIQQVGNIPRLGWCAC